jgi:hypothetical protein
VVAMQYEITDPAALVFSCSFYESIARGSSIDRAVTLARESVKMTFHSLEWATPVLFLASGQAQAFVTSTRSPDRVVQPAWTERAMDATKAMVQEAAPVPGKPAPAVATRRSVSSGPVLQPTQLYQSHDPLFHFARGPNDLLAAAGDAGVHVLTSTGRALVTCSLSQADRARRVAWSPWPRHLATMHDSCTVVVWDLESAIPLRTVPVRGPRALHAMAFSPDGRWIAVTGTDL